MPADSLVLGSTLGLGIEELEGPLWAPTPGSAVLTFTRSLPAAVPQGGHLPSLAPSSLPSCAVFSVPITTVPTTTVLGTALRTVCFTKALETTGLGSC